MGWPSLQWIPFHQPTAVHPVALVQDTPDSMLERTNTSPGFGLGVVWIDQAVPFQRSARGPPWLCPTAVQALGEVQDNPSRAPPPVEVAVGWITHAVPFHLSASGAFWPLSPTAVHELARHQTLERTPPPVGSAEG